MYSSLEKCRLSNMYGLLSDQIVSFRLKKYGEICICAEKKQYLCSLYTYS